MITCRHFLICTFCIAIAGASFVRVHAAEPTSNPCVVPSSKMDEKWWADRHWQKLEIIKNGGAKLLFIGDSITHGWEGVGKNVWAKFYAARYALNLGFGGDCTQN